MFAPKTRLAPPLANHAVPHSTDQSRSRILGLLKWPTVVLLAGFALSEAMTDGVYALQWLWFVPRPILAGAALALAILALIVLRIVARGAAESRTLRILAVVSAAFLAYGLLQMWGLPKKRPFDTLRIVHWNASYPVGEEVPEWIVVAVLGLDADVIVLTDPGMLVVGDRAERLTAAGYALYRPGSFALLSRLPVLEAVPIVASNRSAATRLVIETKAGALAMRVIDLPSDPRLSRIENARDLAANISKIDPSVPDILVGDFNITGGSESLTAFGRGYRDAFAEVGVGWGGTYPRAFPLWRIDLTLVRPPWRPVRAEVIDLLGKRHRAQVVDLVRDLSHEAVERDG